MQASSWDHTFFHSYLPIWVWKKQKGRKEKITKIWISREKKIFLDKTKSIFHSFLSATIWLKIKNSRHKNVVGCWMFAGKDIDADINTVF